MEMLQVAIVAHLLLMLTDYRFALDQVVHHIIAMLEVQSAMGPLQLATAVAIIHIFILAEQQVALGQDV